MNFILVMQPEKVLPIMIMINYHQWWHLDPPLLKTQAKWHTLLVLEMMNQYRIKNQKSIQSKSILLNNNIFIINNSCLKKLNYVYYIPLTLRTTFTNYYSYLIFLIYRSKTTLKYEPKRRCSRSKSPVKKLRSSIKDHNQRYRSRSLNKTELPSRFLSVFNIYITKYYELSIWFKNFRYKVITDILKFTEITHSYLLHKKPFLFSGNNVNIIIYLSFM